MHSTLTAIEIFFFFPKHKKNYLNIRMEDVGDIKIQIGQILHHIKWEI